MKTKAFIVRLMSPYVVKEISRVINSNKFLSKMTELKFLQICDWNGFFFFFAREIEQLFPQRFFLSSN